MANRPSRVSIAIYSASTDGRFYGRYPNGDAPGGAALQGLATAVATALGSGTTGSGFVSLSTAVATALGSLTTVPAPVPMSGGGRAVATAQAALTTAAGISISTGSPLIAGNVGTAYSASITAAGGTPSYTFAVTVGSLPGGLSLSTSGVITGTPTTAATSNFTIRATDSLGANVSKAFALTVNAASGDIIEYANGVKGNIWSSNRDLSYSGSFNYVNTTNLLPGHSFNFAYSGQFAGWQHATNWPPEYQGGTNGADISSCTWWQTDLFVPAGTKYGLAGVYSRGDVNQGADIQMSSGISDISKVPGVGTLAAGWNLGVKVPFCFFSYLGQYNQYKWGLQESTAGPTQADNTKFVQGNLAWIYRGNPNLEAGWSDSSSVNVTPNYSFIPNSYSTTLYAANSPPSAASLFSGTIVGATLTITAATTKGPIVAGQGLFYPSVPAGLKIVSGSGAGPFTLNVAPGNVTNIQMMSVMRQVDVPVCQMNVTAANGELKLMYAGGFDLNPYDYFTMASVPTKTGNRYSIRAYDISGVAIGSAIVPSLTYTSDDYGLSTRQFTAWAIPLTALGVAASTIGGIGIKDTSGIVTANMLSAVGFFR